jgi:hypothetical protein
MLDLDPAKSPGVLDTATWDREAACRSIGSRRSEWLAFHGAALRGEAPKGAVAGSATGSILVRGGVSYLLARLGDGQSVFLSTGPAGSVDELGEGLAVFPLDGDLSLSVHPADADVIDLFCRALEPPNAPRVLGQTPRLGIGTRMTTRIWPGIFRAMEQKGFAANAIQNSVRELNLLGDLKEGRPPERNIAFCFGEIESGYTGSTFEGLWVSGVLAALMYGKPLTYGADADHIQLKRTDIGLSRALSVVEAARHYSFFTLDPSDLLGYGALRAVGSGGELLREKVADPALRREVLTYHAGDFRVAGLNFRLDADLVGRLVGKYWDSMEGTEALVSRIRTLKRGEPFDLEFAYDENPPEIDVGDCISIDEENLFVIREARRRGIPLTHIAPNFGVEKGRDYRIADGLPGLGGRVQSAVSMAEEFGLMVDVHSADDLSRATRAAIGKAGGGRLHYKISPSLMYLFAECIHEAYPELFLEWWRDAVGYAERESNGNSPIARECLQVLASSADPSPSPRHEVFHQFYFAFSGRRDGGGRFANREKLYSLSPEFYSLYRDRVAGRLCEIADDVLFV